MWNPAIFAIKTEEQFKRLAMETFRFQYREVAVYRQYCDLLRKDPDQVTSIDDIPFLPIDLFKSHKVMAANREPALSFSSSGTTSSVPSYHHLADPSIYHQSAVLGFESEFGPLADWTILALLPSYLERGGSSLVYMIDHFIQHTGPGSGFYLDNRDDLITQLRQLETASKPTLLIGVSFALLDLAESMPFPLNNTMVMETGGMKGRRKEMVRAELHSALQAGFGVAQIGSEYGMTELLSQAYSKRDGLFRCPPWMRVLTRDTEDPFNRVSGTTGGIDVIDLANFYSCSFIATQDLGRTHQDGSFEVLGRFDHSDIRGCNLMMINA